MLFVPLPLFATMFLVLVLCRILMTRDMRLGAHQLFACLVGLYAVQSLLVSLRWGYEIEDTVSYMAILAPVLPAIAYLAYAALVSRQTGMKLWPLAIVGTNWLTLAFFPLMADSVILMTYFGFGGLLLRLWWRGADALILSPINDTHEILIAMCLTGVALIASGITDVYLIYDFVQNDGRNAGLVITFVQTAFVLAIGVSAALGRAAGHSDMEEEGLPQAATPATEHDSEIIARLEVLFERDHLHKSEDLSLRRLARRLGLPDRQVSNAINRVREMSVSQFVNDFRIKEACSLLNATEKTVLEISLAAGFATKSNFNREFLRVTGQTPSRWRNAKTL